MSDVEEIKYCETCAERGLKTPGVRDCAGTWMCDQCFNGEDPEKPKPLRFPLRVHKRPNGECSLKQITCKVSPRAVELLDEMCQTDLRTQSEVVARILERALEIAKAGKGPMALATLVRGMRME
jgi:hypothetical protein